MADDLERESNRTRFLAGEPVVVWDIDHDRLGYWGAYGEVYDREAFLEHGGFKRRGPNLDGRTPEEVDPTRPIYDLPVAEFHSDQLTVREVAVIDREAFPQSTTHTLFIAQIRKN